MDRGCHCCWVSGYSGCAINVLQTQKSQGAGHFRVFGECADYASQGSLSTLKPEALRWPPPPYCWAIAETSNSPTERRENCHLPSPRRKKEPAKAASGCFWSSRLMWSEACW